MPALSSSGIPAGNPGSDGKLEFGRNHTSRPTGQSARSGCIPAVFPADIRNPATIPHNQAPLANANLVQIDSHSYHHSAGTSIQAVRCNSGDLSMRMRTGLKTQRNLLQSASIATGTRDGCIERELL